MKLISLLLVIASWAQAQNQEYRADQIRGIKIIGWKGNLTMTADPKADVVRHKFTLGKNSSLGNFTTTVTLEEGWLNLRVVGPTAKADWRQDIPRIDLEIRSKSVPVTASWVDGDVQIRGWAAPVQLTHRSGKVKIEDGKEAWKLSLHEGELDVNKFAGSLEVESYASRLAFKKVEGRMKLENFQGRLTVEESKGDISLRTVQGKNSVDDFSGGLDFDNIKGDINFSMLEGSVQGKAEGGSVEGRLKGPVEVRIRGDDPRLNLQLQKGVGARVDLGTSKGTLSSSLPLKSERLESIKLLRGQVSGGRVASVFVRLQAGEIRMR